MKKIRSIALFCARNENDFVTSSMSLGSEITFPPRSEKQQISFIDKTEVCIDLIHYNHDFVKQFPLREGKVLAKDQLVELGRDFSFDVVPYPLYPDILSGIIPEIEKDYGRTYFGSIAQINSKYFFLIFGKRGTTNFEDDIIYIHGLWEVELVAEFKEALFVSTKK